jgi:hypothetical protein
MRSMSVVLLIVYLMFCSFLVAQDSKVNFSGEWAFNQDKSETGSGGQGRGFGIATKLVVKQEANKITVERTGQGRDDEYTRTEEFTLDGKKNEVEGFGGRIRTVIAQWTDGGKTLTISSVREGQSFQMTSTEVWSLLENGKVLSIASTRTSSRGERKAMLVYDKAK